MTESRCPACGGRKTITVARGAQPAPGVRGLVFLPPSEVPCPCVARDAAEARVAELETDRLVLWWFLNDNPDQPMPPGANPAKQAIEAIQALREERDEALRLAKSDSARVLLEAVRERLCPKPDDDLVKRVEYLRGIESERDRLAEIVERLTGTTADGATVGVGDEVHHPDWSRPFGVPLLVLSRNDDGYANAVERARERYEGVADAEMIAAAFCQDPLSGWEDTACIPVRLCYSTRAAAEAARAARGGTP